MNKFYELGIHENVLKAIEDMGFETPSPIQEKAIPVLLNNNDIIGQAQTGTGKTLAFASVLLSNITDRTNNVQAIVLSPTRELALQIEGEFKRLGKYSNTRFTCVYGGSDINKQIKDIKRGVEIVVGTPGRVNDLIRRNVLKLNQIQYCVLDEADEMLNMGFLEEIETILEKTPSDKQTILFSATMPKAIKNIAKKYLNDDYKHVRIEQKTSTADTVKQFYYEVKPKNRFEALCRLIDSSNIKTSIIFCRTKRSVDEVTEQLQKANYSVSSMHGDLSQNHRMNTLRRFKNGEVNFLVATDVAARGIDVEDVSHVINYELPQDIESYVHRIGRTGRANKKGLAYTIISSREKSFLRQIEKSTKCAIEKQEIPTISDIQKNKLNAILSDAEDIIIAGKHKPYKSIVNELDESQLRDFTAALFSLAYNENTGFDYKREKIDYVPDNSGNRFTRLFITAGTMDHIDKKQISDFFVKKAKIKRDDIGSIDIKRKFTFVNIDSKHIKKVINNCHKEKINKRRISIEVAN